jgi:Holliday junction resolvase RusA-like endonuclease
MIKSIAARQWDAMSIPMIRRAAYGVCGTTFFKDRERMPLRLEILVYRPSWYCKTKTKRNKFIKRDASNFIKAAEDSLMKALGLDDSAVFEILVRKVGDVEGGERTLMNLCFWEPPDA